MTKATTDHNIQELEYILDVLREINGSNDSKRQRDLAKSATAVMRGILEPQPVMPPELEAYFQYLDAQLLDQHMQHCNQGEWEGVCKYEDKDCPALCPIEVGPEFCSAATCIKCSEPPGFWGRQAARQADKIKQLEAQLAALEHIGQEPVADIIPRWSTERECVDGVVACLNHVGKQLPLDTKLYAHPPHKEWHSLTDEDIVRISVESHRVNPSEFYFARALEAILKEKNRG
jgi:hypothetical protein